MIDTTLPLETLDGRPVTFVRMTRTEKSFVAAFSGWYDKRYPGEAAENQAWYREQGGAIFTIDGNFAGGHPDSNVKLRNADVAADYESLFDD